MRVYLLPPGAYPAGGVSVYHASKVNPGNPMPPPRSAIFRRIRPTLAGLLLAALPAVAGGDWPEWRGAERDGVAADFELPAEWPEDLVRRWSVEVGLGYATPLLVGDAVYQFARQGNEEVMLALDAATGAVRWRSAYPAEFAMSPATARHRAGPKSTPAYRDGRLYAHGMTGSVTAWDAATGERVWHVEGTGVHPLYHTAMSPLARDELVIVHVGGHDDGALTAFDAATGAVRWSWDGDGPAYGSPMLFEFDGVPQVVTFTQNYLVGVSFRDGALLWRRPFTTPSDTTSQTPARYRDMVIENGRANGITAFRVSRDGDRWSTRDVWHTDDASLHMANPVVGNGVLFGLSHRNSGQYVAIDLENGETLWRSAPRQADNAAMLRVEDIVVSLETDAELVIFGASRDGLEEIRRYPVGDSETWTQPTLAGDRIFVKDISGLTLYALR